MQAQIGACLTILNGTTFPRLRGFLCCVHIFVWRSWSWPEELHPAGASLLCVACQQGQPLPNLRLCWPASRTEDLGTQCYRVVTMHPQSMLGFPPRVKKEQPPAAMRGQMAFAQARGAVLQLNAHIGVCMRELEITVMRAFRTKNQASLNFRT